MSNAVVTFNSRTEIAKANFRRRAFKAIQDTFELDIKPEAAANSPVLTGTNKRSIDTEVTQLPDGTIQAKLFTQSGYGAYLELGTRFMKAVPYLWPAFEKFVLGVNGLRSRLKEGFNG